LGCIPLAACGGGGAESETQLDVTTTTKGQELQDLQAALNSGAITQEQYETEKKKILDRE
jgi:hypothetical protein